jgi:3-hydroxy-5-methyl-1-naphthoate 3-O-methyltransferase
MSHVDDALISINRTAKAYKQSIAVLTANELGIFNILDRKKAGAAEIAKKLKLDLRALKVLLNALVNIGFLNKKNDLYSNVTAFYSYLLKDGDHYIGDSLKHDLNILISWSQLPQVIKSGKPARKEKRSKQEQENFILAMANSSELRINDFFNNIDLTNCKKFLDVGGGPGTFSIFAANRYPKLTAFNYDLPETLAIAKKYIAPLLGKERVTLVKGDYFKDELGKDFDTILISNIIHSMGEKDIIMLFKKAFRALNNNGKLIVKDFYIKDNRIEPQRAVLFAINMLVNTKDGSTYSVKEVSNWLKKAGFAKTKYKYVNDEVEFIEASK